MELSPEAMKARKANDAVYCRSLKDEPTTIRLLHASRILLYKITGNVTWTLEDYKLDSSPKYTALSYVWGRETYSNTISLDGKPFLVLDNLFPVLEAIRTNTEFSLTKDSWWWIDSICINQNDGGEAVSQMDIMGDIYQKSDRTIGWFGSGSGSSGRDEDEDFVRRGEEAIESLLVLRKYRDRIVKGREKDRKATMKAVNALVDWEVLQELLARPWWTRVWTLQEYLLAPNFEFWCGRKKISKKNFKPAIYAAYKMMKEPEYAEIIRRDAWLPVWNRRRLFMWHRKKGNKLPLVALVAYGSDCKATKPQDRIYSVSSGLAKGRLDSNLIQLKTDEEKTAGEVYQDFALSFVREHGSLDIICYAHVFKQTPKSRQLVGKLPSWVPDWSVEVPSFIIPVMASQSNNPRTGNFRPVEKINIMDTSNAYAAAGTNKFQYKSHDDGTTLICKGVLVDTIATGYTGKNREALTSDKASSILDDLASTLVLGREDRYLSTLYAPGCFYHDLRAFCKASKRHPKDVPDAFVEWFRQLEDFHIGKYTLGEIVDHSLKKPDFAQPYRSVDVSLNNDFLSRFEDTTSNEGMERKILTTEAGRFGMGPRGVEAGDRICVLLGCSIPLVLRPKGNKFELVGECYLNDFMDGEAIEMVENGVLAYENEIKLV